MQWYDVVAAIFLAASAYQFFDVYRIKRRIERSKKRPEFQRELIGSERKEGMVRNPNGPGVLPVVSPTTVWYERLNKG